MTIGLDHTATPTGAPPSWTVKAEHLRAALALATFASTDGTLPTLTHVRVTIADGELWAQATDRYVAALYRALAPDTTPVDLYIPRADALKAAKALRTAVDDVELSADVAGWLRVTSKDRKGAATVTTLRGGTEAPGTWPAMTTLLNDDRNVPATCAALDPSVIVAVAEWQKLAGGGYASPCAALVQPLQVNGSTLARFTIESRITATGGLVAVAMGIRLPVVDLESPDLLDDARRITAAIVDGAPR